MKKTFLTRRNALLTSSDVSWGAFALAAVVLALLLRLLAPNAFWYVFTPAFRAADTLAAGTHAFLSSFGDTATLTLRNERLAHENAALAVENLALVERVASLESLDSPVVDIIAGVVARPPTSPYDTLVLSKGSDADVVSGMEAFGEGGVPLGIVSSVLADFSRVTLFSSPDMVVDGWVGHAYMPVALLGAGGGAMRASVSRSADIATGDSVFVPGPGMLPVGRVVRVDSDPSLPTVTLHIQLLQNLFSTGWVELRATGPAFVTALSWATTTPL